MNDLDGRIADVAKTGFIRSPMLVHQSTCRPRVGSGAMAMQCREHNLPCFLRRL